MLQIDKILLPVDFSALSHVAARQAGGLARYFHSEVTVLHVVDVSMFQTPVSRPEWLASHKGSRQRQMETFGVEELQGVTVVKKLVCCGDPARVIIEYANAEKAGLILMPTHGAGPFRRFLLGSITAKVLHDAECPVWTGTHLDHVAAADPAEIRHVMCAVNFGPQSTKSIRWAAGFAAEFGAKLTLVHAVLPTPPELPERYTFQWHEEAHWAADERLRSLVRELHVDADVLVVDGDPSKVLAAAAKEKGAGLIVMSRTSASGTTGKLGSRAYGVICYAPCPVVSI